MPWIWSDELAKVLLRTGLATPEQVVSLVDQPRAVAVSGTDPLEILAALADDEPPQRRVA